MASNISESTIHFVGNDPGQDGGRFAHASIPSLLSHWKMNDNAATTSVADDRGNYNGTAQQNTEDIDTTGKINGALTFNGSADYIDVGNITELNGATEATFSFWINPDTLSDFDGIIAKYVGAGDRFLIQLSGDGLGGNDDINVKINGVDTYTSGDYISASTWTHVAVVYDGSQADGSRIAVYIGGVSRGVADNGAQPATLPNNVASVILGNDPHAEGRFFDGAIDDVRIYTRVLAVNEIASIYSSGSGSEESFIVGDLDAGGGCTLATFSGDLSDYMGAYGAVLYNNAGCTLSDSGGSVKITSAGNFATGLIGIFVNCDFSADFTDGVYPITASDANSITIDLTWGASVATAEVWVGGAFPSLQDALDDDSTDVSDGAATHDRTICTNLDETIAASETTEGGDRTLSKYLRLVSFHTKLYKPAEDTSDTRIISDMDEDSYSGDYASQFSTSYYGGYLDAARKDESKTQRNANATWVEIDADGGAIDVFTVGGDNVELRNFKIFKTDKAANNNGIAAAAAREGTRLVNCWVDTVYNPFDTSNLDESTFQDCYFGSDQGDSLIQIDGAASSLFDRCFFNGTGLTIAVGSMDKSVFYKCIIYKGAYGINPAAFQSFFYNCIFFDQTVACARVNANDDSIAVFNCILSPAAVADYGLRVESLGTYTGSNNIVYSVTADGDGTLTNPFYNDGDTAAFWLPNTIESDPDFVDATNFDFRVNTGSPAINAGIGMDGDRGDSSIGLDALDRAGGGGGRRPRGFIIGA